MPVTFKAANVKYKSAETGQYIGVNSVSDNTTAEQIALIEEAGEDQIEVIETAEAQYVQTAIDAKDDAVAAKNSAQAAAAQAQAALMQDVETVLPTLITNPDSPPLDRTLTQPLAAAPADLVGDLKSAFDFNQYSGVIGNFSVVSFDTNSATIQTGKRLAKDGTIVTDSAYNVATYTALPNKKYLIQLLPGATYTDLRLIELLNNNAVVAYQLPERNAVTVIYVHDFAGTIRVSYRAVDTTSFTLRIIESEEELNISKLSGYVYESSDTTLPTIQTGKYITPTGDLAVTNGWEYVDFVEVKKGTKVIFRAYGGNSALPVACLYNESGTVLSNVRMSDQPYEYVTYIVPTSGKMRFCSYKNLGYPLSVYISESNVRNILFGKRVTVIGDSITEHNFTAKKNWTTYMAEWAGCTVQNLGISGTGFAKTSPYINRISSITNPDIIGVAISFNDMAAGLPVGTKTDTGTSSIAGYANAFFDALITAYPTTPIICYAQSPWGVLHPGGDRTDDDDYVKVIGEICELKGVPYYPEAYYGCVLKPWIDANKNYYYKHDDETSEYYEQVDNVHPNSIGHKAIFRYLYPHFATNCIDDGLNYLD